MKIIYDTFIKNKYYRLISISRHLNKIDSFQKKESLLICSELNDNIISFYNIEDTEIYNILIKNISRMNVYFSIRENKRCSVEGGYKFFVENDHSITRLIISLEDI
ncbi:MAG: hypothetical protein AABY22_09150 [Nanoarchaeota archaeon]